MVINKDFNLKTLITFVHFNRINDSVYKDNLDFFLKVGLHESTNNHFNFVINSETGGSQIPIKQNVSIIKGYNKGYDFGAYKQSIDHADWESFDRFIFINDTARGPFIPNYVPESINWVDMFLKDINEKVKLVGPTWFNKKFNPWLQNVLGIPFGNNNHIQSWCFGLDKVALRLLIDYKKFDSSGKSKDLIVKDHEIGMSRILLDNNFSIKPFQLSRSINEEHDDINHNNSYFGTTLNPLEVMFYKVKGSGPKGILNNQKILENYTAWKTQDLDRLKEND